MNRLEGQLRVSERMRSQEGMSEATRVQSLGRQGSLYNLTLDEVQHQLGNLGKPLGSMNLDELLKSVWSAEPSYTSVVPESCLQRQGSLTLSRDLSRKTVEEVWRDIQQQKKGSINTQEEKTQERQPTLGEMTLEDFLAKAGVVSESDLGQKTAGSAFAVQQNMPQPAQWMSYQLPSSMQQQNMMSVYMPPGHPIQQPLPVSPNPILDAAYSDPQMNMSPSFMGALSDTQTPGRKRVASGDIVEKTVERRQKRMIKNRESAARSRARKQVEFLFRLGCLVVSSFILSFC